MRDDVREALAITRSSTLEDRTVDITTTGRRSAGSVMTSASAGRSATTPCFR